MQWFSGFLKTTLLSFSFHYLSINKELILMFIIKNLISFYLQIVCVVFGWNLIQWLLTSRKNVKSKQTVGRRYQNSSLEHLQLIHVS